MTESEMRQWIDNASYTELLRRWRFAPSGHEMFQGEVGKYYADVMVRRREEAGAEAHTAASKQIGWEQ